jgi:Asp-tRNA(Asn)/Glu-tRNA(Gln) amidotransferase A subunit family amidase
LNPEFKSTTTPFLSFWDYHEAYTQFKTTPLLVARQIIDKLKESHDMHWIRFQCQDILDQAEASTKRYERKAPLSQMDGCFITIKEELDIQGLETKIGTKFINNDQPASDDATLVTKLKGAGVIVIGSAVMNELGWDVLSVNPNTGMPKNPYEPNSSCGGSSGGSGGCVAGGLVTSSIGADGGGSVRIPAAFCGLYGLKTSYGRVSGYGGAIIDPTVGSYGPIGATADDMTLTYCITSGPDKKDANSLLQPAVHLDKYDQIHDLSDLTIAITPEWNKRCVEPAILQQLNVVQQGLEKLGARFVEIDIPDLTIASAGKL